MHSEVKAHFTITGNDFDPDVISDAVGITPTRTWRFGDLVPKTKVRMKCDAWRVSSPLPESEPMPAHLASLLTIVYPKRETIGSLREQFQLDTEVTCVIYSYEGDRPVIFYEAAKVGKFAELGAALDVDLYIL